MCVRAYIYISVHKYRGKNDHFSRFESLANKSEERSIFGIICRRFLIEVEICPRVCRWMIIVNSFVFGGQRTNGAKVLVIFRDVRFQRIYSYGVLRHLPFFVLFPMPPARECDSGKGKKYDVGFFCRVSYFFFFFFRFLRVVITEKRMLEPINDRFEMRDFLFLFFFF